MKYTDNKKLKLPELVDLVDVNDLNYNFIKLNDNIVEIEDNINKMTTKINEIGNGNITIRQNNEVKGNFTLNQDNDIVINLTDTKHALDVQIVNITFLADGWEEHIEDSETYYTQTVTANVTSNDNPIAVKTLEYNADSNEIKTYNEAFSVLCDGIGETDDGVVNWKVYKKINTDISIGLMY